MRIIRALVRAYAARGEFCEEEKRHGLSICPVSKSDRRYNMSIKMSVAANHEFVEGLPTRQRRADEHQHAGDVVLVAY